MSARKSAVNVQIQFLEGLIERLGGSAGKDFAQYQDDPARFGEEVLGEHFTDDVKDLLRSVRDNQITIGKSANATGKTHGAARAVLWFYKCFKDSQVYTAAAPPESNLRRLLWGEIGGVVEKHKELFAGDNTATLSITRSPRSFVAGVTIPSTGTAETREAKFSGKHAPYLLFVLDEGDAIPDEVYKGIESCMSGGHARLLILFNPRHESGEVARMIAEGRANVVHLSAFNHPNVITGRDEIPGAVTREITIQRIHKWTRALGAYETPGKDCFELPEYLVGCTATTPKGGVYSPLVGGWRKVENPQFDYMVLGRYPAQATTQLISREWITAAVDRWQRWVAVHGENPPVEYGVGGMDVAGYGIDSNAFTARYANGYVEPFVLWNGIDPIESGDRAVLEFRGRRLRALNVDAIGIGASIAPYLARKGVMANGVNVSWAATERSDEAEFGNLRDQLWWACREWLRTDTNAMLPPDESLIQELVTPTYNFKNGKIKIMDKDDMRDLLKRSPDRADALCLTFFPYNPQLSRLVFN